MPLHHRHARIALPLALGTLFPLLVAACGAPPSSPSPASAATPPVASPSAAAPTVAFSIAGKNLIVNGDAEAAPGTDGGSVAPNVPGWTRTGQFTAIAYTTANSGNYPALNDPGPPDRGRNFFGGGPNADRSGAVQTVDVSDVGPVLDTGKISYTFSGWLGGYRGQDDQAQVTAQFLRADGAVLATASLSVVLDNDRGGKTALLLRSANGGVPAGTRRIKVDVEMIRKAGDANDGYVDDLSLVLNPA
jgi:hypothetical protein